MTASHYCSPLLLTFRHRAGVTTYTSHCWFADGCVFDKQSPGPAFCRSLSFQTGATLLPKLRVHFAEFLNARSLVRLRFLIPPTCVRLRYGPNHLCQPLFLVTLITSSSAQVSSRLPVTAHLRRSFNPSLNSLQASTGTTILRQDFTSCVTASLMIEVPESEPDSHRLRISP